MRTRCVRKADLALESVLKREPIKALTATLGDA